jgi:hypothetical protein
MILKRVLQVAESKLPPRTKDLPATQGMLTLARSELKADVRELRAEMNARFSQMDAKFERVLGAVHHVAAEVARIGVLVEEQNSRNRIVLEGLTGLAQRQDRVESRMDEVEKTVQSIARSRS